MRLGTWLTLSLLTACGGARPLSGEWDYTDEDLVENSCGDALDYDGTSGSFTVENNGDGTFVVDPQDGTDSFSCTADGKDFACPERISEVLELGGGAQAELSVKVDGTFPKKDEATGSQTATFRCLDGGCEVVAALVGISSPCSLVVDFEAEWVADL